MMTKDEFNKMERELRERGYIQANGISRPYYYKVIERRQDKYGDQRAVCQLLYHVYNLEQYADRIPGGCYYGLEPEVSVSRNIDENLMFTISHPQRPIEDAERIAMEFMKFVDKFIPEQ